MRRIATAVLIAATVGVARAEPPAAPLTIGIGGGESDAHTHVSWSAPKRLTAASVLLTVDNAATTGLNFFALQVNFPNGTWAHGGLQDVSDKNGARRRQVNWGGLVNRGGGATDYRDEYAAADLEKIQNPPPAEHSAPLAWRDHAIYQLVVERGRQVTLPPGDYALIPGKKPVHVDHARALWEWRFTARPLVGDGDGARVIATLYDAADAIASVSVWNENGYGSRPEMLHSTWTLPVVRDAQTPDADTPVTQWHRF